MKWISEKAEVRSDSSGARKSSSATGTPQSGQVTAIGRSVHVPRRRRATPTCAGDAPADPVHGRRLH